MLWELIFDVGMTLLFASSDKRKTAQRKRAKEEQERNEFIRKIEAEYGRIPLFFGRKKYWEHLGEKKRQKMLNCQKEKTFIEHQEAREALRAQVRLK